MSDISPADHPTLYRGIKDNRWFAVPSMGFKLRKKTNQRPLETALSVIVMADCTREYCAAHQYTCYGEFVLPTSDVTQKWRVELTSVNHARIHGLPLFGSDPLAIEEAATELASLISKVQERPS